MYHNTAKGLAALGRNGDSMLMHVNPQEVEGLSALLGAQPTTNPETGLPEAFSFLSPIMGILGSVAEMGIGAELFKPVAEWGTDVAKDVFSDPETAKAAGEAVGYIGSGLGGSAIGAMIGAGTAKLTGQNVGYGALGGAGSGIISGVAGGMEHEDLMGQPAQQPIPKPTGYTPQTPVGAGSQFESPTDMMDRINREAALNQGATPAYNNNPAGMMDRMNSQTVLNQRPQVNPNDIYATQGRSMFNTQDITPNNINVSAGTPESAPMAEAPGFLKTNFGSIKGIKNFAKNYGEVPTLATGINMGLVGLGDEESRRSYYKQKRREQDVQDYYDEMKYQRLRGYADGGAVISHEGDTIVGQTGEYGLPVTMKIPQRFVDEFKSSGGLGNILANGFANGGYINTHPFDPDYAYPQSHIIKAQPYAAATPQRHEVVDSYGDGGFIDGEGDGMSDDVDATIDGVEPVKVADGEVIIPKDIVDALGVDALDEMLKHVRMAAHGKAEQIKQDAGKMAFEKVLASALG